MRFELLFAPVIGSLNSVRLPLAVPTPPTAFCVNAVKDAGAPGAPAVVTRPFIWVVAMLNVPFVSAAAALEKYPTSVTAAAVGLMSQLVVMFTADGKLLVAPSVMLAMLCVPPEFTATVNEVAFTALKDTVATFDVKPAWAEAFAVTIVNAARATGRVRSRSIQAVPGEGDRDAARNCNRSLCWSAQTGLIRTLLPRR